MWHWSLHCSNYLASLCSPMLFPKRLPVPWRTVLINETVQIYTLFGVSTEIVPSVLKHKRCTWECENHVSSISAICWENATCRIIWTTHAYLSWICEIFFTRWYIFINCNGTHTFNAILLKNWYIMFGSCLVLSTLVLLLVVQQDSSVLS